MATSLVGVLICGCIAAAATASTCRLLSGQYQPEIAGNYLGFTVNVECLPSGLSIVWTVSEGEYHAELNYICTDTHGSITIERARDNKILATRILSGSVVASAALIQSVLRNGGECIVYGCHRQVHGLGSGKLFYNHNESCEYPQPAATEVSSISFSTDGIAPTSTSTHNSAIIIPTISTDHPSRNDNPSRTYMKFLATSTAWHPSFVAATPSPRISTFDGETMTFSTSEAEIPTSSHIYIKFPTTSISSLAAATPSSGVPWGMTPEATVTSSPFKRGYSIIAIIAATVVAIFAFFILAILVIGIFHCNKKVRMNERLKNLGNALHVDSEKIDPYYAPIQVESYISKCESMGSILEFLTPEKNMGGEQATKFTLPVSVTAQQSKEANGLQKIPMCSYYVLQPPPLKRSECFILNRSEASESKESSASSSDYQSNTSIATTLPHMGGTPLMPGEFESSSLLHRTSLVNEHQTTACSNLLYEQMLCRTGSSSSADSLSTTQTHTMEDDQSLHSKIISYYDIVSQPNEDSDAEDFLSLVQDNRIVLTFSSSQNDNYNESVIIMEPESADSDSTKEELEDHGLSRKLRGSLAETNLTINPHHFDPL